MCNKELKVMEVLSVIINVISKKTINIYTLKESIIHLLFTFVQKVIHISF